MLSMSRARLALACLSFFVSTSAALASDLTVNYVCQAEKGRQQGDILPAEGELRLKLATDADRAALLDVIGFVTTNYDFNVEANGTDKIISNYTGVFQGSYQNRPNYRPTTYRNHYKFDGFNAKVTSRWDGGGMWGYLVVEKANGADRLNAHYVFQAGDHIGGTIDFRCRKAE